MTTLVFPESPEDLSAAFNSAIAAGAMQAEDHTVVSFWARYEFIATDCDSGEDLFFNALAGQYLKVSRKDGSG